MSLYDSPHSPKTNSRLLLVVALCGLLLLGSDYLTQRLTGHHLLGTPVSTPQAAAPIAANAVAETMVPAMQPEADAPRVPLTNARVKGEVNLRGGALDKLVLQSYRDEIKDPAGYALFGVSGTTAEYVAAGWQGAGVEGPSAQSVWQLEADTQTAGAIVMVWRNATGQSFQRTWRLQPDSYLWQVTERVVNTAELPVTLTPYAQVVRHGGYTKGERSNWVNYFGPMGQLQTGEQTLLKEYSFGSLKDDGKSEVWSGTGGWWGMTSQYFAAAIIPGNGESQRQFVYRNANGAEVYTAGLQFAPQVVAGNGGAAEVTYAVYAGPKHYPMLIEAQAGLEQSIAWGWFEPLVKGLYHVLTAIHAYVPNWGLAVIVITLLLKIVTFPLANTSYRAMAKMKKLQPEVELLKKQHEGNQQGMALAMMALYKQHKVNPVSGCWPMLIQIPIFFAMYKVVLVMFEFRHADFLWLPDLAVHDPYFVLPLLMGASMYVQFKLNPKPTDPAQELVFKWMPLMMTVMFLWFPAGLVLYWVTSNILSIGQQALMMKKEKAL